MLNIKSMAILLKITSKLDITPVLNALKEADIFEDAKNPQEALAQLTAEKAGTLAFNVIAEIAPQLDTIATFLPQLAAAYKSVPIEEAVELDALEVIDEIIHDEGIRAFFSRAVRRKVKPQRAGLSANITSGA